MTTSENAAELINDLRIQIDALDESITTLIAERAELSRQIQIARVSAGGTRVELGRERVIREHYRTTLGAEGPSVAEAILRACKRQPLS
jgi:chorismate mutase